LTRTKKTQFYIRTVQSQVFFGSLAYVFWHFFKGGFAVFVQNFEKWLWFGKSLAFF